MKSCLIVDDSRVIRKVIREILTANGFTCEEAENGQQALEACNRQMPTAVLTDLNMPVMNGIEFVRALRLAPEDKQPVVVFCSRENDPARIREALLAGANEYIMKPFDADIIKSKFEILGLMS